MFCMAVPPGETLLEALNDRNISQKELSDRTEISTKHLSHIVTGQAPITPETAQKLQKVLGIDAEYWLKLEATYRATLARQESSQSDEDEVELAKLYPYKELVKYGFIKSASSWALRVPILQEFFQVSSLRLVPNVYSVAFRQQESCEPSQHAVAAWIQQGKIEAAKTIPLVSEFSKDKLKSSIEQLRQLTLLEPAQFVPIAEKVCSDCGISLVFIPYFSKTYINGATMWYNNKKAIVALTARGAWADIFWFTFFHELGHIFLGHSKKNTFINYEKSTCKNTEENDADNFSVNTLIPPKDYAKFVSIGRFSHSSIRDFSSSISISQGIVAGRLAYEKRVSWAQISPLRERYAIN